jgi:hypothetical protein
MTGIAIFFLVLSIIFAAGLIFSLRLNLRYSDKLQEVSDQVDESLDILDTLYQRAATRAQLEVFSDDPVVKELVSDIQTTRDAILLVANLIVDPMQEDDEENKSR